MSSPFFWLAAGTAGLNWISVRRRWQLVDFATKPGVMAALLLWWLVGRSNLDLYTFFIAAAIVFSLLRDIALMPPRERFTLGLFFFLLALIFYSIAFNLDPPPFNAATVLLAGFALLPMARLYPMMIAGLAKGSRSRLKIPLSLYAFGLTLLLFSGLGTLANEAWPPTPALLAVAGCLLFYLSDIILAWNRFVRPLQNARLKNRVGYHLGQIALIAAFLSGPVA